MSCLQFDAMIRTQVQLTEEQMRKLRRVAAEQGISVAEVVRRCIDRALEREVASRSQRYERAARHIGAFHDRAGARRVSEEHDAYLEDAFE